MTHKFVKRSILKKKKKEETDTKYKPIRQIEKERRWNMRNCNSCESWKNWWNHGCLLKQPNHFKGSIVTLQWRKVNRKQANSCHRTLQRLKTRQQHALISQGQGGLKDRVMVSLCKKLRPCVLLSYLCCLSGFMIIIIFHYLNVTFCE